MEPTARRAVPAGTAWKAYARILTALGCCAVIAPALFALSAWLMLRKACPLFFMGCGFTPGPLDRLLEMVGLITLPLPLAVFPLGARTIRGLVYREVPRRRQSMVLLAFAWFGVVEALLAYPCYRGYERARHWVTADRQRHAEMQRLQAAHAAAFGAAPIQAEVLHARLIEEHDASDYGGGTLELTIRVRNAPPIVPYYQLTVLDLAQQVVSGRAHSRLPVEPPYRMAWDQRGASGHVTVRHDNGRWSFVEDGTSRVLDSGPDTFTIRVRYSKRVPGLGPPRGVILYLSVAEDRRAASSESGRLYLAAPFPPFP